MSASSQQYSNHASNSTEKNDYYTAQHLSVLWNQEWFQMFQMGTWCSGMGPPPHPINPMFDSYHPYTCNVCKRGPLTGNPVKHCSKCRVVKYCCKDHQILDWPQHRSWCQAFCDSKLKCEKMLLKRNSKNMDENNINNNKTCIRITNMDEWRSHSKLLTDQISQHMGGLVLHTSMLQIGVMQPRCRRCFAAAADGADLVPCPRCAGVALCRQCMKQPPHNRYHKQPHSNPGGIDECDAYLLNLACDGMVVEQGTPLAIESDSDCPSTFVPRDWLEYFHAKGTDFSALPPGIAQMAPVIAFLTDGLSIPLTIQHALARVVPHNPKKRTKLVIHLVGASVNEELSVSKYIELLRINPSLQYLRIVMIGPSLENIPFPPEGKPLNFVAPDVSPIRPTCDAKIQRRRGYYHQEAPTLETPTLIMATHSGLHDSAYMQQWFPSIKYMIQNSSAPCVFTGWNHLEITKDAQLLKTMGANIIVPPTPNPFRGLRPFIDPLREPADFIYSNASFVIFQGSANTKHKQSTTTRK